MDTSHPNATIEEDWIMNEPVKEQNHQNINDEILRTRNEKTLNDNTKKKLVEISDCVPNQHLMRECSDIILRLSAPFFKSMPNINKLPNKLQTLKRKIWAAKAEGNAKSVERASYLYYIKTLEHKAKELKKLCKYSKPWWKCIKNERWQDWRNKAKEWISREGLETVWDKIRAKQTANLEPHIQTLPLPETEEPKHRIPLTLCTRDLPFFVKAYGREQVARIPEIIDLFVDCVFKLSLKFPFDFVSS
ncbi:hypothetical protein GJ496_001673 [Pomphorhynchus laevis]|nr:hypothetical protein GJ496_001673 [Pomphorhynchus laevis]